MTSQVVRAISLYSDSTDDLETTLCFLSFQDIGLLPMKTQYPLVDLLVIGKPAQSKSQYAVNLATDVEARRMPCHGVPARYLNNFRAACMCTEVGCYINCVSSCTVKVMSGLVMER